MTLHFPLPQTLQSLISFLSVWICLFWTLHINGIIRYVAFWVQLFSLTAVQPLCLTRERLRPSKVK